MKYKSCILEEKELVKLFKKYKSKRVLEKEKIKIINAIISSNIGFVYKIAFRYHFLVDKDTFQDLIQEGLIGLMQAIKFYDYKRKNKFITYAFFHIKHRITRYVKFLKDKPISSLDYLVDVESKEFVDDSSTDFEIILLRAIFQNTFKRFNPKHIKILKERFGLDGVIPKTLQKIGEENNLTKERIRQVQSEILQRIQNYFLKQE